MLLSEGVWANTGQQQEPGQWLWILMSNEIERDRCYQHHHRGTSNVQSMVQVMQCQNCQMGAKKMGNKWWKQFEMNHVETCSLRCLPCKKMMSAMSATMLGTGSTIDSWRRSQGLHHLKREVNSRQVNIRWIRSWPSSHPVNYLMAQSPMNLWCPSSSVISVQTFMVPSWTQQQIVPIVSLLASRAVGNLVTVDWGAKTICTNCMASKDVISMLTKARRYKTSRFWMALMGIFIWQIGISRRSGKVPLLKQHFLKRRKCGVWGLNSCHLFHRIYCCVILTTCTHVPYMPCWRCFIQSPCLLSLCELFTYKAKFYQPQTLQNRW